MANKPCEHGPRRSYCKICKKLGTGGSQICEHGVDHHYCKLCKGAGICEHNRRRYACKECGGKGICEHSRQKEQCKLCKGSAICEHNHHRQRCKECKAVGIGGVSICGHGRQRHVCKDCKGSQVCEHNNIIQRCAICRPNLVYNRYQKDATKRELTFSLSLDVFKTLIYQSCRYCGRSPQEASGMGIDRLDNSIGYEPFNCRACCDLCNYMKSALGVNAFVEHIKQVSKHMENNPLGKF